MAAGFPSQSFDFYHHAQWAVDTKPSFNEEDELSVLDEKILDPTTPAGLSTASEMREDSFGQAGRAGQAMARENVWHEYPTTMPQQPLRHHSQPAVPPTKHRHNAFIRIDPVQMGTYRPHPSWPMSAHSGTSTPTPTYDHMQQQDYESNMPVGFQPTPMRFHHPPFQADQSLASPMSPQSSQGGWMSATSSDATEPRSRPVRSPSYRSATPMAHMRPDGIRKKNARFEIPAGRNLGNIDSLISTTTDEVEKKELKQQKRLLRNRQAALDSRQRKKQHTEKLELEKKSFHQHMGELEDDLNRTREALAHEREQWHHERQYYIDTIRNLEDERDNVIRDKTLETAELRKMNNILKEHIRDFERQEPQLASSGFSTAFSTFGNLALDDTPWDGDFGLIDNGDFKMGSADARQSTPPPAALQPVDPKGDLPFSWNAFYMCLLFGALIASSSNSSTESTRPSIPHLPEEYRAESANVLKAVLASEPQAAYTLLAQPSAIAGAPTTISGAEMARMTSSNGLAHAHSSSHTHNLDTLHTTLTTPSRHQVESAAFSLSAASYNHLMNPDPFMSDIDDDDNHEFEEKPSRLQMAFANMQEGRKNIDRLMNRGGASERSLMWERVPEKVLVDFRRMVEEAEAGGPE